VNGKADACDGGCLIACATNEGLKALVDTEDCGGTVDFLVGFKPDSFGKFCSGMP
jgi:hypothetical protein